MGVTKTTRAFTIVELLIVIIVIAILATVVTVAYSGLNRRAANAQTVSAAKEWAKILQQYIVSSGYPTYDTASGNGSYEQFPCLGNNYPGNVCASTTNTNVIGAGVSYPSTAFLTKMKAITPSVPVPSYQTVYFSNQPHVGGFINLGVSGAGPVSISFFLKGGSDVTCPDLGIGSITEKSRSGDGVYCGVNNIQ